METTALFEEKIPLTPRDLSKDTIDINEVLRKKLSSKLEGRCSLHGWVTPNSMKIIARSMGYVEKGRFTGDIVYHVQAEGKVVNPPSGIQVTGEVIRKNKMGMYVNYKDAIRIILPRDLHTEERTYEEYDSVQIGESVRVEIKKSRFQVNDEYILSVGLFLGRAGSEQYEQAIEQEEVLPIAEQEEAPKTRQLIIEEPKPLEEVEPQVEEVAPLVEQIEVEAAPEAPSVQPSTAMEPIVFAVKTPEYREFNTAFPAPFTIDSKQYPTVEHYLQSMKFPSNPELQEQIRSAKSTTNAKSLADSSTTPIRSDWDTVRDDLMRKGIKAKFTQNPALKDLLLSTENRPLQDGSSTDAYWGLGRTRKGKNRLGVLLMELRSSLKTESSAAD